MIGLAVLGFVTVFLGGFCVGLNNSAKSQLWLLNRSRRGHWDWYTQGELSFAVTEPEVKTRPGWRTITK